MSMFTVYPPFRSRAIVKLTPRLPPEGTSTSANKAKIIRQSRAVAPTSSHHVAPENSDMFSLLIPALLKGKLYVHHVDRRPRPTEAPTDEASWANVWFFEVGLDDKLRVPTGDDEDADEVPTSSEFVEKVRELERALLVALNGVKPVGSDWDTKVLGIW